MKINNSLRTSMDKSFHRFILSFNTPGRFRRQRHGMEKREFGGWKDKIHEHYEHDNR